MRVTTLKQITTFLFLALAIGATKPDLIAQTVSQETIQNYDVNININTDGTINVTEVINYDFGTNSKHGIFRYINTTKVNEENKRFKLKISDPEISMDGQPGYIFKQTDSGDKVEFKIGDPKILISGAHTYLISYKVAGALTYFSDHTELYWNSIGFDWPVPINNLNVTVRVPDSVNPNDIRVTCYTGQKGSTSTECSPNVTQENMATFARSNLNPGEDITIVVGLPTGHVQVLEPEEDKPSILEQIFAIVLMIVVPIATILWYLVLPISILIKWIKAKRNTSQKQKIVAAWFESPSFKNGEMMNPSEVGALIDYQVDDRDIVAMIIWLAQKGYLKITKIEDNNYLLTKIKEYDDGVLDPHEEKVMNLIFKNKVQSITTKELKDSQTIYTGLNKFKSDVVKKLYNQELFEKDPIRQGTLYSVLGVVGFLTFNFILGLAAMILGKKTVKRTDFGIEKYSEAVSLKNFLTSQDEQLDFQAQNQMFFEKLLPYATAFGVEKVWIQKFKDILTYQADWYEGDSLANINFLSKNLVTSVSAASRAPSSSSSSGFSSGFSGGSSGGGGGGGGGGSW